MEMFEETIAIRITLPTGKKTHSILDLLVRWLEKVKKVGPFNDGLFNGDLPK